MPTRTRAWPASRWIYAEIPPGSTLTAEYWDDALPRALSYALSPQMFGFKTVTIDLYRDLPPAEASAAIFADISQADYVVQSSERVESGDAGHAVALPGAGPLFRPARTGLARVRARRLVRAPAVDRHRSDRRPRRRRVVHQLRPSARLDLPADGGPVARDEFDAAMSWALQRPWSPTRAPERADAPARSARWETTRRSTTRGGAPRSPPRRPRPSPRGSCCSRRCSPWEDRSPACSCPGFPTRDGGWRGHLRLAIAAYAVWLGASLELFRFRAVVGRGRAAGDRRRRLVALASCRANGCVAPPPSRPRIGRGCTPRRRSGSSSVSSWSFAWSPRTAGTRSGAARSRWSSPRSTPSAAARSFRPYDPWYADGYVNYYYYGFYLMAFLFKAVGIPSEVGFNLALPDRHGPHRQRRVLGRGGPGARPDPVESRSPSSADGAARPRWWRSAT